MPGHIRIPGGLLHPIDNFGAGVCELGLQRIGGLPAALRNGPGALVKSAFRLSLRSPTHSFSRLVGQRAGHRGADRKADGSEDQWLSFKEIGKRGLRLRQGIPLGHRHARSGDAFVEPIPHWSAGTRLSGAMYENRPP